MPSALCDAKTWTSFKMLISNAETLLIPFWLGGAALPISGGIQGMRDAALTEPEVFHSERSRHRRAPEPRTGVESLLVFS
jgi:hypothetical protein